MSLIRSVSLLGAMFAALATIVVVAGLSSCALKQPAFPTTPAQAEALDRVISAVRDDFENGPCDRGLFSGSAGSDYQADSE